MLHSINICSLQPVSGMHIAQRTKSQAQPDSWPCQVTVFASVTHVLLWNWKEELKISLHFLPEGQSFSLHNLWYLQISCKNRARDLSKSRLCRKESNSELERARGAVSLGKCLCCWANTWICPFQAQNLPARAKKLSQSLWLQEDRLAGSQGDRGATRAHLERCLPPESGSSHDLLNWFSHLMNDLHRLPRWEQQLRCQSARHLFARTCFIVFLVPVQYFLSTSLAPHKILKQFKDGPSGRKAKLLKIWFLSTAFWE